jgi:hypothetical protein
MHMTRRVVTSNLLRGIPALGVLLAPPHARACPDDEAPIGPKAASAVAPASHAGGGSCGAEAPSRGIDLHAGIGGGEYVFNLRSGEDKLIVPFTELGVEGHVPLGENLVLGVQLSRRADEASRLERQRPEIPVGSGGRALIGGIGVGGLPGGSGGGQRPPTDLSVEAGDRWRAAATLETRWRDLRLRGGLVAGTYYNVLDDDPERMWIYPTAAVAVGGAAYEIELGLLDAPAAAASATGGIGVLSLRVRLQLRPGHDVFVGAGAPYGPPGVEGEQLGGSTELGHMTWAYRGRLGHTELEVGGFISTDTNGGFVSVGRSL